MAETKCGHQACHCKGSEVRADGYCSDACKPGGMKAEKCGCGHPGCQ